MMPPSPQPWPLLPGPRHNALATPAAALRSAWCAVAPGGGSEAINTPHVVEVMGTPPLPIHPLHRRTLMASTPSAAPMTSDLVSSRRWLRPCLCPRACACRCRSSTLHALPRRRRRRAGGGASLPATRAAPLPPLLRAGPLLEGVTQLPPAVKEVRRNAGHGLVPTSCPSPQRMPPHARMPPGATPKRSPRLHTPACALRTRPQALRSTHAVVANGFVFDDLPLQLVQDAARTASEAGAAICFDPGALPAGPSPPALV